MRFDKLAANEAKFDATLSAAGTQFKKINAVCPLAVGIRPSKAGKAYTLIPAGPLPVKKKIIRHHTVSELQSAIKTLTESTISVAYVVSRSGVIYEISEPNSYAWHAGQGAGYQNSQMSFETVGIELANMGPLKLVGNNLIDIYGVPYCTKDQQDAYDKCDFRDYDYFATYTHEQKVATEKLCTWLLDHFGLPDVRINDCFYDLEKVKKSTVINHCNIRKDKSDISPLYFS